MPINYKQGKIYKIVDNTSDKIYIGSTCEPTLARRLEGHVSHHKSYLRGASKQYTTSYQILENNDYEIILIESYPCKSKDQLHARERYHIENNECVNQVIPTQTDKEYRAKHAEKIEQYRVSKAEKMREYQRKYREQNQDKFKQYHQKHLRKLMDERVEQQYQLCCKLYAESHKYIT